MSVRQSAIVWELQCPRAEKLVMLALADCANDEGECWPSITTLARKCVSHRSTVMRTIAVLESARQLTRSSDAGRTNSYRLHPSQEAWDNYANQSHGATGDAECSTENQSQDATSSAMRLVAQCDPTRRTVLPPPVALCDPTRRTVRPRNVIEPSVEPSRNQEGEGARAPAPPVHVEQPTHGLTVEQVHQLQLDAWRDVDGCDAQAMESWIHHLETSPNPKVLGGMARISTAKMLAGWGSPERQRAAIDRCIRNQYRQLRPQDGHHVEADIAPGRQPRRVARTVAELEAEERLRGGDTAEETTHAIG